MNDQAEGVYQLHYKLGDKTAIVQKPNSERPKAENIIEWGRQALGVQSLRGAEIDLVEEGDPRFIGTLL